MGRAAPPPLPEPLFSESSSRIQRAVAIAKSVAERHIAAVPEAALNETYSLVYPPGSAHMAPTGATLRLAVDPSTGDPIGEFVDRETGTVVGRVPKDRILRLVGLTRKLMSVPLTKRYEDDAYHAVANDRLTIGNEG